MGLTLRSTVLFFCSLALSGAVFGQSYLYREVNMPAVAGEQLGSLLNRVGRQHHFHFSYDSRLVPADRPVSAPLFKGTLARYLQKILGEGFTIRETAGYVIIRYAPEAMQLDAMLEKEAGRTPYAKGFIKDARTQRALENVSVYERNLLVSTLSDKRGYFELPVKRSGEEVWLTISKEHYRDTTVVLLPAIRIHAPGSTGRYRYYPEEEGGNKLDGTAFGRFFISSRQRLQRVNLGGFFAYSPYQVSLTPGLSSHGMFNSQIINEFSLNLLGGYTAGVNGVEIAAGFNINQKDSRHVQLAGAFNLVGRNADGVQVAGGANVVLGRMSGVQLAGALNQAGTLSGVQVAGAANLSRGRTGTQLAGVLNIGGKVTGVQISALVNVADSSDYPIGFLNFIKNGRRSLSAGADESGMGLVGFRSGGRILYGLLALGYRPATGRQEYMFEAGIGTHICHREKYSFDAELLSRSVNVFDKSSRSDVSCRVLPAFHLGRNLHIFIAPSMNLAMAEAPGRRLSGWMLKEWQGGSQAFILYAGMGGGLRLML